MNKLTPKERVRYYEVQSGNWLATGNQCRELQGSETPYVKMCFAKSTHFLVKANNLRERIARQ